MTSEGGGVLFCIVEQCSENCGWGNQRRHVECIGEAGEVRSESDCPASERPVNELKCKVKECQHSTEDPFTVSGNSDKSTSNGYSWRTGPWSSVIR